MHDQKKEVVLKKQNIQAYSLGYDLGKRDTFLEAAGLLSMNEDTIRLHVGEMTKQEMRTVKAILKWKISEMFTRSNEQ